ncbi:NAD(P)H-quinone oxidoreductase [Planctobacterium marinum]|uniref:NAD(P)H quinone oxidoreductase n=1 Tax=Planctobacterium marinum TaxID=1631968 RepID=A0AA48HUZ5_9ALTE|nr:NAD(P)H quinone oxidoreductase [Planctobacterium marinum]
MQFVSHIESQDDCFVAECPPPLPDKNEVLVAVTAFGINRADLLQKQGKYPAPAGASDILGMEVSGVIEAVGQGVDKSCIGRPVCVMVTGGGYAQFVCVPVEHLIPVPSQFDIVTAAALPEVFLTAYQALFSIANLKPQQKVLIHAGASGVGTAAIQLARYKGAAVAVTASSQAKLKQCEALGAQLAINYQTHDFAEGLKSAKFFPDVIIDFVGEGHLQKNLQIIALDGKIVQLAMLGGRFVTQLDMAKVLAKRVTLFASTLRNRSDEYKALLVSEFIKDFGTAIESGAIKPLIDTVFEVSEINIAHQRMAKNDNIGKFVVKW